VGASTTAGAMETFLSQPSNRHGLAKWPTRLPVKSLKLSNIGQRSLLQRCKLMFHGVAYLALPVTESVVLPSFEGVAECPRIKAFPNLTCLRNIT